MEKLNRDKVTELRSYVTLIELIEILIVSRNHGQCVITSCIKLIDSSPHVDDNALLITHYTLLILTPNKTTKYMPTQKHYTGNAIIVIIPLLIE